MNGSKQEDKGVQPMSICPVCPPNDPRENCLQCHGTGRVKGRVIFGSTQKCLGTDRSRAAVRTTATSGK